VKPPTEEEKGALPPLKRPDLLKVGKRKLSWVEYINLRLVRASFRPGIVDKLLRFFQSTIGQAWIHHGTKNLRHVVGLERLPDLNNESSVIIVANHRSFFDLYVITAELVRRGMPLRIVFMVRSDFFYDSIFGFFVNFFMSFLAMYPPVFRERKKASMSLLALDELAWMLRRGGVFAGLHPEGARKKDDDPYSFLPAKQGIGRLIHAARVPVIPVFVNGLSNDILGQLKGNLTGKGEPIHVVFGKSIDFGGLLQQKASRKLHAEISQRCMQEISHLGEEEKALRTCASAST